MENRDSVNTVRLSEVCMNVTLNNGTLVTDVTPDDLKKLESLGLIGNSKASATGCATKVITEVDRGAQSGTKPVIDNAFGNSMNKALF